MAGHYLVCCLLMEIGSRQWAQVIVEGARAFELDLDHRQINLFATHARELVQWNRVSNLTTITAPFEIAVKHFVDSLAPAAFIPAHSATLLDIGSGGGFPGIPLKIAHPALSVTLIEASRKKTSFLRHVIRTLKLEGIEALHMRAEALVNDAACRRHFDVIVSRALGDLKAFVQLALPLLAGNGVILALKGRVDRAQAEDEGFVALKEAHISNSAQQHWALTVEKYELPPIQSKRSIIAIREAC